jgi:D-alanyl-D-alanine carboxypeptidase/D-alanyl-D-alanine-endopeptidase (penicillin-binding protein 4)
MLRCFVLILVLLGSCPSFGQESLRAVTERIINHPILEGSSVGISIRDASTNKVLFAHNDNLLLVPASNIKLLTTGAAWFYLGVDHRKKTILDLYGTIVDSVLIGEIRIKGEGDPSLASGRFGIESTPDSVLNRWATFVSSQGIKAIKGNIRCTPDRFPGPSVGLTWEWSDLGGCFAQGQWPINWQDNCLPVTLQSDSMGWRVTTDSTVLPWTVIYQPDSNQDNHEPVYFTGSPDATTRWIGGAAELSFPLAMRASLSDPPNYVIRALQARLEALGIQVNPNGNGKNGLALVASDTIWSPSIQALTSSINGDSRNMYAEMLLRWIGKQYRNTASTDGGIKGIKSWLRSLGVEENKSWIYDGSGMSRHNGLSAGLFTHVLAKIHRDSLRYPGFKTTLSQPGESGTVRAYLKDKHLRGKVWAKSGTLNRVRALSGYLETKSGTMLSFSILINQFGGETDEFYGLTQQLLLAFAEEIPIHPKE